MRKLILGLAAAAALATPLVASAANASVTMDADGKGFVGKGDVQTVLGLNNSAMQKAVDMGQISFNAKAPATQAVTQTVTQKVVNAGTQMGVQSATQTATQAVSQELTCDFTNGSGTKTFHRDGERDATRTGTREGERLGTRYGAREGTRTGDRTGILSGAVVSDLNVTNKKTGQYTGWFLGGWKGTPSFTATGDPVWGTPTFGAYTFGEYGFGDWTYNLGDFRFGDYTFEDESGIEWGEWDALPGENPGDCLRSQNADHITQISNVITEGDVEDGAIVMNETVPGALVGWYNVPAGTTHGAVVPGTATATDAATLQVHYGNVVKALPNTPVL